MSNYYTPLIEDIHIGFELECFEQGGKLNPNKGWIGSWNKCIVDFDWIKTICYNYEEFADEVSINYRVKYLDIDDIKELGFKSNVNVRGDLFMGENMDNGLIILYNTATHKGEISLDDVLFKGTIRNKSELKNILKLIN